MTRHFQVGSTKGFDKIDRLKIDRTYAIVLTNANVPQFWIGSEGLRDRSPG